LRKQLAEQTRAIRIKPKKLRNMVAARAKRMLARYNGRVDSE